MANTNTIKTRFVLRNKTAAEWEEIKNTDVPLKGEYCYVTDLNKVKMGDGVKTFYELPWMTMSPDEISAMVQVGSVYESEEPTPEAIGGIPAGWTPDEDMTVVQVIDKLLHPTIAPAVTNVKTVPESGIYEMGDTVTITGVSMNVAKKSNPITDITISEFASGATESHTGSDSDPIANGYNGVIDFPVTVTARDGSYVSVKVRDDEGLETTVNSGVFKFIHPIICGAETEVINIVSLTNYQKVLKECKGEVTVSITADNKKPFFALPMDAKVKKILDQNGFNCTNCFYTYENMVNYTDLNGDNHSVRFYILDENTTVTDFEYTIVFE